MILRGSHGIIYDVENTSFAGGAEGSIHNVRGSNLVAKIYKKPERTRWKQEKIEGMVREGSRFRNSEIAWPLDIIFDASGFVGFVMKKFNGVKMLSVAFTKKAYTFKEKLKIAIGLCKRVSEIHAEGQCLGDLSDNNICVKGDNTVVLVDADSFQFSDFVRKTLYRCCVFTDNFVAPEVLYKMYSEGDIRSMKSSPYSKESDLFVLAIHIFKLLCGSHPFACASETPVAKVPSPNDNIQNGYSPFFIKRTGFSIPAYCADPHFLPMEVLHLFYKAFVTGHKNPKVRPTADEWINALRSLDRAPIKKCRKNSQHIYLKGNRRCPWCEAANRIKAVASYARQPQVISSSIGKYNPKSTATKAIKIKHTPVFWIVTLFAAFIIQTGLACFMYYSSTFCNSDPANADIVMQIVIFMAGIIGPAIYNHNTLKESVLNYVCSILLSPISSVAVVIAALALGAGLGLMVAFGIVAIIIGIFSG